MSKLMDAIESVTTDIKNYLEETDVLLDFVKSDKFKPNVMRLIDKMVEWLEDGVDDLTAEQCFWEWWSDDDIYCDVVFYVFNDWEGEGKSNVFKYLSQYDGVYLQEAFNSRDIWELMKGADAWSKGLVGDTIINLEKDWEDVWNTIFYWIASDSDTNKDIVNLAEKTVWDNIKDRVLALVGEKIDEKKNRVFTTKCDVCWETKQIHCVPCCCKGKMMCFDCYDKSDNCPFCRESKLLMLRCGTMWMLEYYQGDCKCDCKCFAVPKDKMEWAMKMVDVIPRIKTFSFRMAKKTRKTKRELMRILEGKDKK